MKLHLALTVFGASVLLGGCMTSGLVHGSGPRVIHSSNKGELTVNYKHTEAELGVPFYPGSKPLKDGGMNAAMPELTMMMQLLETSDSVEKVVEFYKGKLGSPGASGSSLWGAGSVIWEHTHANGANQSLVVAPNEGGKGTLIQIMVFMPGQTGAMPGQ